MNINFAKLTTVELIELCARITNALKYRYVNRTINFLGNLAEYIAIKHSNKTPWLPKLQVAPTVKQNFDAISQYVNRYSIKATRGNTTGVS